MIKNLKNKVLAILCALAMVVALIPAGFNSVYAADDIIADGIEHDFGTVEEHAYSYGWAAGATSDYKYLILTYSGDIAYLRIQGVKGDTRVGTILWFDQNQADHLTLVGDASLSGTEEHVVVDLDASGIDMGAIEAFDMHYGPGTLKIGKARFSENPDILDTDVMPEETTTSEGESDSEESSTTEEEVSTIDPSLPVEDIILNGDEQGKSTLIKSWTVSSEYKYLGFVTLKEPTAAYKYLILTYAGDISTVRAEFTYVDENGNEDFSKKVGPYWFNKDGQTKYFVTADESDIPMDGGKGTTVVIDLEKTGIDLSKANSMHLHGGDPNVASFTLTVGMARLSQKADLNAAIDKMPAEPQTTAPKATTAAPTTTAAPAPTKKVTIKKGSIKKLTAKKKAIKVSIKKLANAKKYKIQYATKKSFKKAKTKTTSKLTYTIKNLKSKKTYYVRVRGVNGKTLGKWSSAKKIKVK